MFNLFSDIPDTSAKKFDKGSILIKEGEISPHMYLITHGTAAMFRSGGNSQTTSLEEGGICGETSFFLNMPEPATIIALTDIVVEAFDRQNALGLFKTQPETAYLITAELCKRLYPNPSVQFRPVITAPTPSPAAPPPVPPVPPPTAVPAAPPIPAPPPQAPPPVSDSGLFPKGHGSYTLQMANDNTTSVYEQECVCPICGFRFDSLSVIMTRLRRVSTDMDLRSRYAGIEPMHYDIVSCPNCLYSATGELFPTASQRCVDSLNREIGAYRSHIIIKTGRDRDTMTVFAGYYLAVKCAPLCFDGHELTVAGLWQKLSRLYKDCGDMDMHLFASKNALKEYEHVFIHYNISEKQLQQICYIIGDLYDRLGDYDAARTYFFKAKSNHAGTNAMKLQADIRLDDIKEKMGRA